MKLNCLLAGVGGQGTVLASRVLAQTAMSRNFPACTAETIGMAQRGGCVVSQVRIGTTDCGPTIPLHQADLLLGFEPAEALRNFSYLKEGGIALINISPILPVTASLGGCEYNINAILEYIRQKAASAIFINGNNLCQQAGSAKVLNVIMLGVAARENLLPFTKADLLQTLMQNLPEKFLELNRRAFEIGYTYKEQGRGMTHDA